MSRICLGIICLLVCVLLTGCMPVMRDLQLSNIRTGLFPMHMELAVGQGRVDAGRSAQGSRDDEHHRECVRRIEEPDLPC